MSLYVPAGTSPVITSALARIERRLPQSGEVLVRVGQRVEPEDIIARAFVPGTPQIINIARALTISPTYIERVMRREVGNKVNKGEVLARSSVLSGRTCLAPVSGVITAVDSETGYVTITPDPTEYQLQATIRGLVMEVMPYEGVRIETPAAQIYGVFGFGAERSGVLRLLVTDPVEPILPDKIDARCAYAILIGGSGITASALRLAIQKQVRGIIVGSIEEAELREFLGETSLDYWRTNIGSWNIPVNHKSEEHELTLVVTEGFGNAPMSSPLFELLAEHDRQEALIEGHTHLRNPQIRPRVAIPLSARSTGVQLEATTPVLKPGANVRLLDAAHLGQTGRIRTVSTNLRRLSSRVRTSAVEVTLDNGTTLLLPRTAIEILN
ncbi:MAG: hypothetical protein AAGF95_24085 [Chloroflexota bacterium]